MIHFLNPGQGLLDWMQALPVSEWISQSNWGFPIMLVLHSWGMAAVVGILVMLDLRILGFARVVRLSAFQPMMGLAWAGFFVNLVSGVLMFMADANRLIVNWSFLSKMSCVVVGGIVTAALWRRMRAAGALQAHDSLAERDSRAQPAVAVAGGGGMVAVKGEQSLAGAPLAMAGHPSMVQPGVAVGAGAAAKGEQSLAAGSLAAAPLAIDRSVRILAIISLVTWTGAILFGRWIAYVMDNMILHGAFGGP
jgi:hypothetical protein